VALIFDSDAIVHVIAGAYMHQVLLISSWQTGFASRYEFGLMHLELQGGSLQCFAPAIHGTTIRQDARAQAKKRSDWPMKTHTKSVRQRVT
jgi:hypothetical protein